MTDVPIVISATPTAFDADGSLDLAGTHRLFRHVADSGVDALFVAGTTGEFPALSDSERISIIASAVSAAGPERVIAHVGAASAYQAANLAREARAMGARRFAAITPYYLPAGPYGVRAYFEMVAAATGGLPLYAYLIPQNSGTRVTPADLARLVNDLGLAGAKISIPGTDFLADVSRQVVAGAELYSGNDHLMREVMAAGGRGVVSGVSPACPDFFTGLARAVASGDVDAMARHQELVDVAVDTIGPSLSYVKEALYEQGLISSITCRMAVDSPDEARRARIEAAWRGQAGATRTPG